MDELHTSIRYQSLNYFISKNIYFFRNIDDAIFFLLCFDGNLYFLPVICGLQHYLKLDTEKFIDFMNGKISQNKDLILLWNDFKNGYRVKAITVSSIFYCAFLVNIKFYSETWISHSYPLFIYEFLKFKVENILIVKDITKLFRDVIDIWPGFYNCDYTLYKWKNFYWCEEESISFDMWIEEQLNVLEYFVQNSIDPIKKNMILHCISKYEEIIDYDNDMCKMVLFDKSKNAKSNKKKFILHNGFVLDICSINFSHNVPEMYLVKEPLGIDFSLNEVKIIVHSQLLQLYVKSIITYSYYSDYKQFMCKKNDTFSDFKLSLKSHINYQFDVDEIQKCDEFLLMVYTAFCFLISITPDYVTYSTIIKLISDMLLNQNDNCKYALDEKNDRILLRAIQLIFGKNFKIKDIETNDVLYNGNKIKINGNTIVIGLHNAIKESSKNFKYLLTLPININVFQKENLASSCYKGLYIIGLINTKINFEKYKKRK